MGEPLDFIRHAAAGSTLAFREQLYRRGDQGRLLRDLIALANAAGVGSRYMVFGVADDAGARRFPGLTERSWQRFKDVLPEFLARAVEPDVPIAFEEALLDGARIGIVRLDRCDDPPYLLARRVSAELPAGGGWIRSGTRQRRLLRRHLQDIFAARFQRAGSGELVVGFSGELPREEIELEVLPLDQLPSAMAAGKIERMLRAKEVSKSVLGRTDSRIARLVHLQVSGEAVPYREQGTRTMRVKLSEVPLQQAAADDHYQYELRAHRINLCVANHGEKAQTDLVLTLTFPRVEGLDVATRVYPAQGSYSARHRLYPKVDRGPKTITAQVGGLRIPKRGAIDAFIEPLRLLLRGEAAGQVIRVAYTLRGPALPAPVRGRLKIHVPAVSGAGTSA